MPKLKSLIPEQNTRRFEYHDHGSHKYWEIWQHQRSGWSDSNRRESWTSKYELTTKWGRVGTKGTSKTRGWSTERQRNEHYDKIIDDKLKKGYKEIGTPVFPDKRYVIKMPDLDEPEKEQHDDPFLDRLDNVEL